MHYSTLHCNVVNCTTLHYTVLHYIVLHSSKIHCSALLVVCYTKRPCHYIAVQRVTHKNTARRLSHPSALLPSLQCTVYSVYIIQFTVYIVRWILYIVYCILYTVYCIQYTVQYTVTTSHYTLLSHEFTAGIPAPSSSLCYGLLPKLGSFNRTKQNKAKAIKPKYIFFILIFALGNFGLG